MPLITPIDATGDTTLRRRQELAQRWLAAATYLAEQADDTEARQVLAFLKERLCIGAPRPHNDLVYVPRSGLSEADAIFLVPMISADYWTLPWDDYWRGYASPEENTWHRTGSAEFYPFTRAIYVPGEWQDTDFWKGRCLLHEGLHAHDRLVKKRRMPKPFWRRERNAHLMEIRILRALGGAEFANELDELIPEVERQRSQQKDGFRFHLPESFTSRSPLEEVFWTSSGDPYGARNHDVGDCATWNYFEGKYGPQQAFIRYGQYVQDNYMTTAHPQHLVGMAT